MSDKQLKEFCEEYGQSKAAEAMSCTQGAVSKMLKSNRNIFFSIADNGLSITFYERKELGKKPAAA